MDLKPKMRTNKYDRVMSRVYNQSKPILKSSSVIVTRHDPPSSVRLSANSKPSVIAGSVYSELPTVLNDYVPYSDREKPKRRLVVKPRKTLKSLDPALSPPRPVLRSVSRPQYASKQPSHIRAEASAPSVLTRDPGKWSESHVRQCYSSRSHSKLKELKDEIQMYHENEKLMKIRSRLYKSCGVVLDDFGFPAADKAIQVECADGQKDDEKGNIERRIEWLKAIKREDLLDKAASHARVCQMHFPDEMLLLCKVRTRLKYTAVPTLFLPTSLARYDTGVQAIPEMLERDTQTDQSPGENHEIVLNLSSKTRKRKVQTNSDLTGAKRMKLDSSKTEQFFNSCDTFLSRELAGIVKQQARTQLHCRKKDSSEFKAFCLNLYYSSPQAYGILKSTLSLPREIALLNMLLPQGTHVENHLIDMLRIRAEQMTDMEKNCSLVIGTMSLKPSLYYNVNEDKIYGFHEVDGVSAPEPAKHALVAMVQGLFNDYSQPVKFELLAENKNDFSISEWLDNLMKRIFEIGLNIRVLIGAGASVSLKKPYNYVGDKKIYYMADPPRLMKLMRNNLMTYEFHFDNFVAKWDHILQFYEKDKMKQLPIAPKLTESHLKPNHIEKLDVKYAVQTLSATVARGLSTYKDLGAVESSAEGTVNFIRMMNDLFDTLNSSALRGATQFQNAFVGEAYQVYFMNQMMKLFYSLKVIDPKSGEDVTSKVKFIEGFQLTLRTILLLFVDLKKEGHPLIQTRRLNQDCLESFFESAKNQSKNPTAWQLIKSLRKMCYSLDCFKPIKEENRLEDLTKILKISEEIYNTNNLYPMEPAPKKKTHAQRITRPEISKGDYAALDFQNINALVYTTGFLLKKCLDRHEDCDPYEAYITTESSDGSMLITYKFYNDSQEVEEAFLLPNDDFVQFVVSMESKFNGLWSEDFTCTNVMKSLLEEVEQLSFEVPCKCFPLEYCKKLFMRMKLFHTLKYNNLSFRKSGSNGQLQFFVTKLTDLSR